MNIFCFGDSNTYGYDPRSFLGGRYDTEYRWTDILARETGHTVINNGINGQEIPTHSPSLPDNMDVIIIMLGTNDLLQGGSASFVTKKMEFFLNTLSIYRDKLLIIAPPTLRPGAWISDTEMITQSLQLGENYRLLANRMHISFLDAKDWNIPLCFDGVHFTEEGHRIFARRLINTFFPD